MERTRDGGELTFQVVVRRLQFASGRFDLRRRRRRVAQLAAGRLQLRQEGAVIGVRRRGAGIVHRQMARLTVDRTQRGLVDQRHAQTGAVILPDVQVARRTVVEMVGVLLDPQLVVRRTVRRRRRRVDARGRNLGLNVRRGIVTLGIAAVRLVVVAVVVAGKFTVARRRIVRARIDLEIHVAGIRVYDADRIRRRLQVRDLAGVGIAAGVDGDVAGADGGGILRSGVAAAAVLAVILVVEILVARVRRSRQEFSHVHRVAVAGSEITRGVRRIRADRDLPRRLDAAVRAAPLVVAVGRRVRMEACQRMDRRVLRVVRDVPVLSLGMESGTDHALERRIDIGIRHAAVLLTVHGVVRRPGDHAVAVRITVAERRFIRGLVRR